MNLSEPAYLAFARMHLKNHTPLPFDVLDALINHIDNVPAAEDRTCVPVARNRRLTDSFLREVAQAYREALDAGNQPTQAVSEQFNVPHPTAARWVMAARKIDGGLGPAIGTKGGEA